MTIKELNNSEDSTRLSINSPKDTPNNKYSFLLEIEILNHLIRVKYDENAQKENRNYAFADELIKLLATSSRNYLYNVLGKLEEKEFIVKLDYKDRKKPFTITEKGELALMDLIKKLYPDKKQRKIAWKMYYDQDYLPK